MWVYYTLAATEWQAGKKEGRIKEKNEQLFGGQQGVLKERQAPHLEQELHSM